MTEPIPGIAWPPAGRSTALTQRRTRWRITAATLGAPRCRLLAPL